MKRHLLLTGVIAPVGFIAVFLVAGATRSGYNPWTMFVSQLATGPGGWVQTANFLVYGVALGAFAVALRQAIKGSSGAIAAPILLGLYAVAMLVAGVFTTDPNLGYPVGAPAVHTTHGTIHAFAGLSVFTLLPAAAFVMAWHFGRSARSTRWAVYSAAVGVAMILFFFGGFAVGQFQGAPTGLYQRVAIITGWTWIAMVAWFMWRARRPEPAPRLGPAEC
jgi:Protein of unknown function (DUF998)